MTSTKILSEERYFSIMSSINYSISKKKKNLFLLKISEFEAFKVYMKVKNFLH